MLSRIGNQFKSSPAIREISHFCRYFIGFSVNFSQDFDLGSTFFFGDNSIGILARSQPVADRDIELTSQLDRRINSIRQFDWLKYVGVTAE
jgi:hypothetical protein